MPLSPEPSRPPGAGPVGRPAPPRLVPSAHPALPLLEDLPDVAGRRVLVRCDFNVPVSRGHVVNDLRLRAATPTLEWLVRRGATVTACSHLGRPAGGHDGRFDMEPVRQRLHELVPEVRLMDNLRFDPGEEANDPAFVEALVADQDLYVNDAFASAHRAHASVVGPPGRLPSAAGRLLAREVAVLSGLRCRPRRPFVAVLGGLPDPEKLQGLRALVHLVDTVVLGGPLAFSAVAAAEGRPRSAPAGCDWSDLLDSGRLVLPIDLVVAREGRPDHLRPAERVPAGWRPVDIGHRTASRIARLVSEAGTVFWDGAVGAPIAGAGTTTVAEAVAGAAAFTVVSGVDTLSVLDRLGLGAFIDHVSTGGAASLAFLREGELPGLRALLDRTVRAPVG